MKTNFGFATEYFTDGEKLIKFCDCSLMPSGCRKEYVGKYKVDQYYASHLAEWSIKTEDEIRRLPGFAENDVIETYISVFYENT